MLVSSWLFGYCWRAVIAGNTRNMNHGGKIANNYLRISENIFHRFIEILLTSYQTLKNKAFHAITSQGKNLTANVNFQPTRQVNRQGAKLRSR
jgi:hypothetical protein